MIFDRLGFRDQLEAVTRRAIAHLFARVAPVEISGIALFSDESAMTMCLAMNTFSHLAEVTAEDPEYATYFRWAPGEWADDSVSFERFGQVSRVLYEAVFSMPDSDFDESDPDFDEYVAAVYGTAVDVLEQLRTEGVFDVLDPACVLTFAVSDFTDLEMEVAAVRRLNSPSDADEFAAWLEAEEAR